MKERFTCVRSYLVCEGQLGNVRKSWCPYYFLFTGLKDNEKEELETLLKDGFDHWNRLDFRSFLKANELNGRKDIKAICQHMDKKNGKTAEDVERYYHIFWKNYKQISSMLTFFSLGSP